MARDLKLWHIELIGYFALTFPIGIQLLYHDDRRHLGLKEIDVHAKGELKATIYRMVASRKRLFSVPKYRCRDRVLSPAFSAISSRVQFEIPMDSKQEIAA